VFRDLAISYLKRNDLGQVKPEDLVATGTKGDSDISESKVRGEKHSTGFRPNATVAAASTELPAPQVQQTGNKPVTKGQDKGGSPTGSVLPSPTALPVQPQPQIAVLDESNPEESEVIKIVQARIKGYEGDPCPSCGSFTLVRNGTCMKCDSCGGTTGCS
jgi:ribonucleoside-diphosphate reductase alpha chain